MPRGKGVSALLAERDAKQPPAKRALEQIMVAVVDGWDLLEAETVSKSDVEELLLRIHSLCLEGREINKVALLPLAKQHHS